MRKLIPSGLAVLILAAVTLGAEQQSLPADFATTFESLAALVDQETLTALDMARGSYLATRFFSTGQEGLPYLRRRFYSAHTPGEASMSGLFMTIHGGEAHTELIRAELEKSPLKRSWLRAMVGTPDAFRASMESGMQWKPLLRILPSTEGSRHLALSCMKSEDALVRRAGLYWGYWMPDENYWKAVHLCSREDRDDGTRNIAQHLLAHEKA